MKLSLLLIVAVWPGLSALADDAPLAGYHLKNRSSFDAGAVKRPPFWPIGWVHQDRAQTVVAPQPKVVIDAKMFAVTSILVGQPSLAVINGRTYGEGDLIKPTRGKTPDPVATGAVPPNARIRVKRIVDGSVTLITDDQTLVVPLKRPELLEHKSDKDDDTLLNGQ